MTVDRLGGLSRNGLARIDDFIAQCIADGELAGAAINIARHGERIHRSLQGLRDIASNTPVTEDTIYRIYSMTKPVTAAAMMILHDRGLWDVNDPIARHLPEFADLKGPGGAPLHHPPMMRELMTHTAGFAYGVGLVEPRDATDEAYVAAEIWRAPDLAEFTRRLATVPLAYQPGSAWRYSLSMDVQGAIIERLTGRTLPDFMREELLLPLSMVDTDFFVPETKLARMASLYHKYETDTLTPFTVRSAVRDPSTIPPIAMGGGGLFSTLDDYARFAQMLLNRGELAGVRVLTPQAVALMTANHLPQAIIDRGVDAGFQQICPGRGYAFNGAVFYDPALCRAPVGKGTYQWDGASAVWFWVDPENDLAFVGMIQRMMQDTMPAMQATTQALVAEALA